MLKKITFYIKHLVMMSTVNKMRLILTAIGIFVAIFIYSVGIIVSDSYYNEKFAEIDAMDENAVVVDDSLSLIDLKRLLELVDDDCMIDEVTNGTVSIASNLYSGSSYLNITATFHGISNQKKFSPVFSSSNIYIPCETKLLKGRLITEADNKNEARVVVINESMAKLLFPGEDAIGKYIFYDTNIAGTEIYVSSINNELQGSKAEVPLEIIGIIEDEYITEKNMTILKGKLNDKEDVWFTDTVYIPATTLETLTDKTSCYICFDASEKTEITKEKVQKAIEYITHRDMEKYISTKEDEMEKLQTQMKSVQIGMNVIAGILCLISGISIMCIVFFSVKERIPEIGIRKAFGAGTKDIIFQIVFEVSLIATIASVFAVGIAYLSCSVVSTVLLSKLYISFPIHVANEKLLLPVLVGILEAIICGVIPGIYGAHITVTAALKFD